jgi:hypothetical protein
MTMSNLIGDDYVSSQYENMIYDDFFLVFCNDIFIFVINDQGKTSSLVTYDEYENLVIERKSFVMIVSVVWTVGDSPEGPLKQPGESCLKPAKNQNKAFLTEARTQGTALTVVAPAAHQSGPVEGSLEQAPPRSRVHDLPRANSASLEGSRLPRANSASLEGSRPPRASSTSLEGSSPPCSRPRHEQARSRTRVRAFNVLTRRGSTIIRLGIMPRPCRTDSLGEPIPATVGDCAIRSVSAPWPCAAYSRTANTPCPRRGAGHTLEPLSRDLAGPGHDARLVGRHPRHCWSCTATPVLAAPRRALLQPLRCCEARGEGTPPRLPLYPVRISVNDYLEPVWGRHGQPLRPDPRSCHCSGTRRAMMTRSWQGPSRRPPTLRRRRPYPPPRL